MFRTNEPLCTPAPESASPIDIFHPAVFEAWLEAFDRRQIARYSDMLARSEANPDIFGEMGDLAARSIMAQPAIVWG